MGGLRPNTKPHEIPLRGARKAGGRLWGCGRLEGFRVVLAKGMNRKGVVTMAAKELVESRWIGTAGD